MQKQSKSKIFLAEERGLSESDWYRRFSTFNGCGYHNRHKHPFEGLYLLNDETLAGERSLIMPVEYDSCIIVLPLVGTIGSKGSCNNISFTAIGQLQVLNAKKNTAVGFFNPYKDELVNFLQVWIRADALTGVVIESVYDFDLKTNRNQLADITGVHKQADTKASLNVLLGEFDGRKEATYKIKNKSHGLFFYVIQGAFEVEGRLLHARDGLAIWDISEAELEALSNDAIILLLEVPLQELK